MESISEKVDENQEHLIRLGRVLKPIQAQSSTQNFEYFINQPATSTDDLKGIEEKLQKEGAKDAAVSSSYNYQSHWFSYKQVVVNIFPNWLSNWLLVHWSLSGYIFLSSVTTCFHYFLDYLAFQVSYLSLVGGRNVRATIREVLKKIATKSLLRQYSKDGQKGKKRLKDHKMVYSLLLCEYWIFRAMVPDTVRCNLVALSKYCYHCSNMQKDPQQSDR